MIKRHIVFVAVVLSACMQAHPVEAPKPIYPSAIRTANVAGKVVAHLKVDRAGKVNSVAVDSSRTGAGLFQASVKSTLWRTRFIPARTFGISHSSTLEYEFHFVLFKPDRPLLPNEKWIGVDTLPTECPTSRAARRVIICGEAVPSHSISAF
jgi:TonB family protein